MMGHKQTPIEQSYINFHSFELLVPPIVMTEEHEIREQLDAFKPKISLPTINLEEAYAFASLLLSSLQLSIEKSTQSVEPTNSLVFPEISDQDTKILRMRGQVRNIMEGSRSRQVFD
jgi:hypothetical protein